MSKILTEQDVIGILSSPDVPVKELAKRYNTSVPNVYSILNNKNWKSIDRSLFPPRKDNRLKLTEEQVFAIRAENHPNIKAMAKKYNLSEKYILQLRTITYTESWKRVPYTYTSKGSSKITAKQAAEIKAMKSADRDFLAKHYGLSSSTITKIRNNKMWKKVKPASYDLSLSL